VLCCAVLCCAVLCCAVLCCAQVLSTRARKEVALADVKVQVGADSAGDADRHLMKRLGGERGGRQQMGGTSWAGTGAGLCSHETGGGREWWLCTDRHDDEAWEGVAEGGGRGGKGGGRQRLSGTSWAAAGVCTSWRGGAGQAQAQTPSFPCSYACICVNSGGKGAKTGGRADERPTAVCARAYVCVCVPRCVCMRLTACTTTGPACCTSPSPRGVTCCTAASRRWRVRWRWQQPRYQTTSRSSR